MKDGLVVFTAEPKPESTVTRTVMKDASAAMAAEVFSLIERLAGEGDGEEPSEGLFDKLLHQPSEVLLLVGPQSAGKTRLLKYLLLEARPRAPLRVLLVLFALSSSLSFLSSFFALFLYPLSSLASSFSLSSSAPFSAAMPGGKPPAPLALTPSATDLPPAPLKKKKKSTLSW